MGGGGHSSIQGPLGKSTCLEDEIAGLGRDLTFQSGMVNDLAKGPPHRNVELLLGKQDHRQEGRNISKKAGPALGRRVLLKPR